MSHTFRLSKLVRDRIVELNLEAGDKLDWHRLAGDDYVRGLITKLKEETGELDSGAIDADELLGELADLSEVIDALVAALGFDAAGLAAAKDKKRAKTGGFAKGDYVETITIVDDDSPWVAYYQARADRHPEV